MSATLQPFGLRPVYAPGQNAQARRYDNGIASGYASGILKGQPVTLNSSGQIVVAANGADWLGSFAGITYFDASGIPHSLNQWIAGQTYQSNTPLLVWVFDDPTQEFAIQAAGSLAQSNGCQISFTTANIAAGSTLTGLSAATAAADTLTTSGQGMLRITELDLSIGNAWGDAYTIVKCQNARHVYVYNKVAV
jgi:hypothetical protein